MAIELTVTAKGQVTLRQAVLEHLGVGPGGKAGVSRLPDGRVELTSAAAGVLTGGGDFADGVIQADAIRGKCRHIVTSDRDFAGLLDPEHVVLLRT